MLYINIVWAERARLVGAQGEKMTREESWSELGILELLDEK